MNRKYFIAIFLLSCSCVGCVSPNTFANWEKGGREWDNHTTVYAEHETLVEEDTPAPTSTRPDSDVQVFRDTTDEW